MTYLIILSIAFGISFLGQIVLSNMNMAATQLSVQEGFNKAWKFGIGVAIVEIIYLRLALTGMSLVTQYKYIFKLLGWITVVVFLILGVLAFISAYKQVVEKKGLLINNKINRFLLGVTISALNPVQIPFWFLWSTQLIQNNVLQTNFHQFNFFCIGAGLGTLAGIGVYIHGGNWAINKMKTSNKTLNLIMGVVFFITAIIQLYRIIYKPWI
ncbi:MAG TPA: LysE family transporter [Chitinophagaceae bacterium]|nr:LysE family translocator [Chitinophagaceae bacterium]HMZ46322.1 LysE family transporter [Chitinophagaceae bacterium]HNE94292.1 LysE family transporter [Chitinophagaceae bacterium]HNJ57746.1 LysE family transporter [Chitinophagaceae bacterium]HNM33501.1 LysE family transporter [Chitinophagaceae bacterium]